MASDTDIFFSFPEAVLASDAGTEVSLCSLWLLAVALFTLSSRLIIVIGRGGRGGLCKLRGSELHFSASRCSLFFSSRLLLTGADDAASM